MLRSAVLATASAFALVPQASHAQSSTQGGAQNLPSVTVEAPGQRARPTVAAQRQARGLRTAARARTRANSAAAPAPAADRSAASGASERANGPVNGYVANRSLTGTKTNTPIMETPQSLSVIGAEQIRDQNVNTKFDETLRYTPGVFAGTFGNDTRQDWFQIRGFPSQDVGTFLDGLQLFSTAFGTWKLQPWSLDRVEVLRGPSAVLYGGSSPSGIVNAVSKLAYGEPIRFIEAGVNNFGNSYVQFDVGGPATLSQSDGKFFYRFVGQVHGGGTQVDFTNDNSYFLAPSFTWMPDSDTRFTLYAQVSHTDTRGQNFLPYVGTVVNAPYGRIPTSLFASDPSVDRLRRDQEMIGYQFEKNLSDSVTIRQNARYAHVDVLYSTLFGLGTTTPGDVTLNRGNFFVRDKAGQADVDTQFEYRVATGPVAHTFLLGFDLKHYGIDDYQGFGGAAGLNLVNPVYAPTAEFSGVAGTNHYLTQNQKALYVQDQMKLGRFTFVLSGRNDWVDTVNNNHVGPDQSREDSRFSGRVGAIYNFDMGLAPYVSYATSYNPVIGTNSSTGNLLVPETGEQAEIGLKYQPVGLNARFGISLFDLKRKNVLTSDPTFVVGSIQTGEVTSRGVELEAVANITPDFKVTASYTNFDLFVSKDLNPALIGTVPTNTPRQLASLWGDYTFREGALNGFGFGGGVRYVGSSFADTANKLVVPSVVLGDLAVHYEWQNWRAAVNFINIADTIYVASCSSASSCFYGDRRRITGSLSYKW
ncbi:TonB-dependent siderophore receptor [Bradyrhizobium betae]|uniref:TonB-dependent siderophore receptor n=2 Tax=Bradyrhizobium betae TaxID=244734 RepID=A0A4Q1V2Y7_9BRAD|nr:TonB-dependent siderophore receptor [Bradyrhizobium betae]RXT44796.1 TonB-dependent siderophore receptor [Bradyrhizobium betae]